MSHYMTALAMKQTGLKPAAKIVLYWLADHHNGETGACFPSLKTLEAECEMNRSTIVRHLTALEEAGLISRIRRTRDNGSQTSTTYLLKLAPVAERNGPCCKMQQEPVAKRDPHNLGSNNLGNITININTIFDSMWEMYPKKVGKGTARKALAKALSKAPVDKIQHSLALFVRSWGQQDKKFMPHLATWLNGERWDDEIQQPSLQDMTSDQQMQAILGSLATDRKMIQ